METGPVSQIHRIHEMLTHLKTGTMNLSPCPTKNLLKKGEEICLFLSPSLDCVRLRSRYGDKGAEEKG